jgi:hypothetical protein
MRWTLLVRQMMRAGSVRSSRVVLIPRRWGQVRRSRGGRRRGLRSPVPRGERGAAVKTIAQGVPVRFGFACGEFCSCGPLFFPHTGLRVRPAPGIPCALTSRGTTILQDSGGIHAARMRSRAFSFSRHSRGAPLGASPESILSVVVMDSGFSPAGCPGMTRRIALAWLTPPPRDTTYPKPREPRLPARHLPGSTP